MKVALVHHWLVRMRGGEKVLEAMTELFPEADIFTLVCDPERISEGLRRRRIRASWLNRLPLATRLYPNLLPLYPPACESLDLRSYDLIISSDASLVKGVRRPHGALHICYCHSPPRYLWDMTDVYLERAGPLKRAVARCVFPRLRRWDRLAARRVDHFAANSENVRRRVLRHYGRNATVIYPPVEAFEPDARAERGDYYLVLGQLVPYKRMDLAVAALTRLGRRLVVIGEGSEESSLRKLAGPTVEFLGWQPDEAVRRHLASCRALVFPGEEDFGIVPVEGQMAGRPVIAYGKGGALETVIDGVTGLFFDRQEPNSLAQAVLRFEEMEPSFPAAEIRRNAMRFERNVFLRRFDKFVSEKLRER